MIIHGDNLEALTALLPEYEGKVDCIYIDPPYNTGNEGWVYNDSVNDLRIGKWLGEVVGKEGEGFSRPGDQVVADLKVSVVLFRVRGMSGCSVWPRSLPVSVFQYFGFSVKRCPGPSVFRYPVPAGSS